MEQHPSAVLREVPGQAVGVADGEHRQPGLPLRLEVQAVAGPLPSGQCPHTGHPGPEGEDRPQVVLRRRSVEGDPRPGVITVLGRQIQDAPAGLNMCGSRVVPVPSQPVHRSVKSVQLLLGVVPVFRSTAVRHAQVGEDAGNPQIFQPEKPGQGSGIL